MFKEFEQFLLRGNAIDLAVGVVIGAAFSAVVSALVADFLTPLIAAIARVPDFSGLMFTINDSQFKYGHFINTLFSFLIVSTSVFLLVVKPKNILIAKSQSEAPVEPTTKKCPECLKEVPVEAKRCSYCTQLIAQEGLK
jgi:large conductance mechanosensitive channel